jgi:hypothetical protein
MAAAYLTWALLGQYGIIAAVYAYQQDWPKCLYFASSATITLAVIWMK